MNLISIRQITSDFVMYFMMKIMNVKRHVFYDENYECEAIEIFDEVEVYVNAVGRRKRRT